MVTALTTFTLSLSSIDYEIFYGLPGGRITIYDFRQCKHKENDNNELLLHAHILPTPHLFHKVVAQIYILYLISKLFSARESKRTTVNTYRQGSYN